MNGSRADAELTSHRPDGPLWSPGRRTFNNQLDEPIHTALPVENRGRCLTHPSLLICVLYKSDQRGGEPRLISGFDKEPFRLVSDHLGLGPDK